MGFLDRIRAEIVDLEPPGEINIPTAPLFHPSRIIRSLYLFQGNVYAVESGVVAADDLDRLIPDWGEGSWTVWPAFGLPGNYRVVHRLVAMTDEEFLGEGPRPMHSGPSPFTPD